MSIPYDPTVSKRAINKRREIHRKMEDELARYGTQVDAIFYCPHHPDDNCDCRKPKIALFLRAVNELDVDPKLSFVVGDMELDIDAGKSLGCRTVLVNTGPRKVDHFTNPPDYTADNLLEVARWITGDIQ